MVSISKKVLGGDPVLPDRRESSSPSSLPAGRVGFPSPTFAKARKTEDGKHLPQAIAHRGYKAAYPENTMLAFRKALEVGAHALETDIHLTKDDVVVLSHDPTLKRCFGKSDKIVDLEWEYVKTLKTTTEPHEPMPRLEDLLTFLSLPENEKVWTLLDIKVDNDPEKVMRLIAKTIAAVPYGKDRPWQDRIVLGIWAAKYVPLCAKYLPGFSISYIGFSLVYARQFFKVDNVSFNMLIWTLIAPFGPSFIKKAHKHDRPVFAWTVNDEKQMKWSIEKHLDGVISDDPKKFLEVCEQRDESSRPVRWTMKEWVQILRFQVLVGVYYFIFLWRVGWGIDKRFTQTSKIKSKKDS